MSLVFRSGRTDDVPAVARLASHSFPGVGASLREWEDSFLDSPRGGVETLWVGEEDGKVLAACRLYSFQQWIGGRAIPVMGLGTVTISATSRRRGLAGELVASALAQSRARGDIASALFPFRTNFYRKLGYGLAGEIQQYRLPPGTLPDHPGRERVRLAEGDEDRAAIAQVYDRWAPGQTGQIVRPHSAWEIVWQRDTRHAVVYYDESSEPQGYAVFRYLAEPPRAARILEVEEIVWTDRDARLALYGWISSMSDQWETLLYRAHPEEMFSEHLGEVRYPIDGVPAWHFWFPAATTHMGPMFRLLDVGAAWQERTIAAGAPMSVALEVHDGTLEANSGWWSLDLSEGGARIQRGQPPKADLTMRVGIEALSRIYIGAITPSAAQMAGLAEVSDKVRLKELDSLFALPRPWTFERF